MRTDPHFGPAASPPSTGLSGALKAILAIVFPIFLCGGVAAGFYFYDTVRLYVARLNLPDPRPIVLGSAAQSNPVTPFPTLQPPKPEAGERINILLLGIDRRPTEKCPCRSDTMIVGTFDPKTKTAGMLSIPRDLYVPIPAPGAGQDRINTALFYGEATKYPGGGPALAKKTVEYNLGIPIHYYVQIDFGGFRRIIDALGGIDIDVPAPIHDSEYPTENYGVMSIDIPSGHVHMNGELALQFARTRHTTNDFDRSRRQMQILLAVRDKALQLNVIPKLPVLLSQLRDAVETDITPQQILTLAPQVSSVKPADIKARSIDQRQTVEIITNAGADVLWPERSKIALVVREIFPELTLPQTTQETVKQEAARVAILNGTPRPSIATSAASFARNQGINATAAGNADRLDYTTTAILGYSDKPATIAALARIFNVPPGSIRSNLDAASPVDVRVIVGADWSPQ